MSKENINSFFSPDIWDDESVLDEVTEKRISKMAEEFANKFTDKLNSGELDGEYGEEAYSSFEILTPESRNLERDGNIITLPNNRLKNNKKGNGFGSVFDIMDE